MSNDIDEVEEIDNKFQHAFESESLGENSNGTGDSASLKNKLKDDSNSRKKLEQKLEDSRINRQIREFDFDDLDI
jgi:superoxide dismutase